MSWLRKLAKRSRRAEEPFLDEFRLQLREEAVKPNAVLEMLAYKLIFTELA